MAIIKSRHASNFTVIPNEVFKSGIDITSVGLLVYLLSLPHDWVVQKTSLHKHLGMGRVKLDTMFKDLQKHGYIISIKHQSKDGISYEHIVYDKPFNGEPAPNDEQKSTPPTKTPHTENLQAGNVQLLNTNILNKQYISTKEQKSTLQVDISFSDFWEIYSGTLTDGNRNRKLQAEKQWSKLNNEEREMAISYARKTKQMNKPPSYVMSPDKMLKDKEFIGEPHMHVEKRGISGIVGVDRAMKDEQDRYYSRQSKQEVIDFINLRKEKDIKSFTTYEYTCKTYGLEQRFKDAHYFYHGNPY
jgi:hypothetical protein